MCIYVGAVKAFGVSGGAQEWVRLLSGRVRITAVTAAAPTILATTMGFHRGGRAWTPSPVFDLAFRLAGDSEQPRLCLLATGSGDSPSSIVGFYGAFAGSRVQASHVALFEMPNVEDVASHLLAQDVIWVDRGSVVNLLAVWRAHQLDEVLHRCWQAGVVLAGESAGSLCWHAAGSTDAYGPGLSVTSGLGWLPYANAVHYRERRKHFHRAMRDGLMPDIGYATDVGAGLVYRGTDLVEVVVDRSGAGGYRVQVAGGEVVESALPVRRLG